MPNACEEKSGKAELARRDDLLSAAVADKNAAILEYGKKPETLYASRTL